MMLFILPGGSLQWPAVGSTWLNGTLQPLTLPQVTLLLVANNALQGVLASFFYKCAV